MKLFKNLNEEKKVLELKIVKNLKTKFCSVIRSAAAGARGEQHGGNHLDKQGKGKSKEIRKLNCNSGRLFPDLRAFLEPCGDG